MACPVLVLAGNPAEYEEYCRIRRLNPSDTDQVRYLHEAVVLHDWLDTSDVVAFGTWFARSDLVIIATKLSLHCRQVRIPISRPEESGK